MTIHIAIILPLLMAAFIPFLHHYITRKWIGWFVLAAPITAFILLVRFIPHIASGETITYTINWMPSLGIQFTTYLDGLSMLFSLLITGVGTLVVFYAIFYLSTKEALHHFYCYLLLFMGAMLGVVFSDNLIVLYAFWELTSVSSFLLIAFWHHRRASRHGARKSMLITVTGGIAMLAGFLMLYVLTDTFSIREIIAQASTISTEPLFIAALLCILLGAFTKSAQFPFHIWLPQAMEAPTPVSAYLHSATMVKAGIYIVARMTPIFAYHMSWFWIVTFVGLITLFWGSFNAVKQTDLKALLAFSTVSQLGMIMSLFGMGSIAYHIDVPTEAIIYAEASFVALFHLVNHSTFKGALFMMVGIIDHEAGTRDVRKLGGLMTIMPATFTIAVIGSLSMAGLPPFNGFLSKEMFLTSALEMTSIDTLSLSTVTAVIPIIAWVASVFTFIYCMIIIFKTFLGQKTELLAVRKIHEAPIGMLISPFVLVAFVIGIFFFPNVLVKYVLAPAMLSVFPTLAPMEELAPKVYAWHGFNTELLMTIGIIVFGLLLYMTLSTWRRIYDAFPQKLTLNSLFDRALVESVTVSSFITKLYMTRSFRHYMLYIYVFVIVVVGSFFIWQDTFRFSVANNATVHIYEVLLVFVMAIAAIAMLFVKSRVTAVVLNGVLGFGVSIFFVIFRAPDLALTQLIVESVTTVLFLLCFTYLPEWKRERSTVHVKVTNAIISVAVGMLVVAVALSVIYFNEFKTISSYFENAYELAGGKNIVNTILGDFRAFDTMLEVVVLCIAGLGVYTMMKFKAKKGGDHE
ncbi:Na+/H+ antiporter subunit A [Kurthia massiliensis]|uniref:Na+/H+ antiporter subunit A n=1 Tax=Kurthia massiliensis TaxID=1033739 RepID=UPI0002889A2A|nr:Na+/H+ antiporter subunit A [Kurthia massiliensis]